MSDDLKTLINVLLWLFSAVVLIALADAALWLFERDLYRLLPIDL